MKIETKFSIGDVIYYIRDNKVHKDTVNKIEIVIEKKGVGKIGINALYSVGAYGEYRRYEKEIFANKEELLESL